MSGSATLTFNAHQYPFHKLVGECVQKRLGVSTATSEPSSILPTLHELAKPSDLDGVYAAIYDLFLNQEFTQFYDAVCTQIIMGQFAGKASYQRVPSVRIQMPGQTSVNYHTDEWYGHGHDVQNLWLPLTRVAGTNSLFVSDEETSLGITNEIRGKKCSIEEMNRLAKQACRPLTMDVGEIYLFNSHIIHGTEINLTNKTRVSFDFRMLREGDDRGLKDESFFLRPGQRSASANVDCQKIGAVYIGKRRGFSCLISQKFQVLLCNRYAVENNISVAVAETELCGFDHLPTLWNIISGNYVGRFTDLVIFSAFLLPQSPDERQKIAMECAQKNLTLHFVIEDVVAPPNRIVERVEAAYRRSIDASISDESGEGAMLVQNGTGAKSR